MSLFYPRETLAKKSLPTTSTGLRLIFNAVRRARVRLSFPTPSSILNRNLQLLTLFFPTFETATRRHVTRSLNYLYMHIRNLTFKRFCDVPLYKSRERYRNKVAWISKNIKPLVYFMRSYKKRSLKLLLCTNATSSCFILGIVLHIS